MKRRLLNFFLDHVNWCHGEYHDGTPKPPNRLYEWFWNHWLWPFDQNECICCNTVRGVAYGLAAGFLLGRLI